MLFFYSSDRAASQVSSGAYAGLAAQAKCIVFQYLAYQNSQKNSLISQKNSFWRKHCKTIIHSPDFATGGRQHKNFLKKILFSAYSSA